MSTSELRTKLRALADPERAVFLLRFFKSGPGDYGEGDKMLGLRLPDLRKLVRDYRALPIDGVDELLQSEFHEERLAGLLILVEQFRKADPKSRKRIYEFYLSRTGRINNWDLVDSSAAQIAGAFLEDRDREPLHALARSASLWERRIAMVATLHFIRKNDFGDATAIAERLLDDREDLIHKAVGWMLREVGKRDVAVLREFLARHAPAMPRTSLRYAIERFPEDERKAWLRVESTRKNHRKSPV